MTPASAAKESCLESKESVIIATDHRQVAVVGAGVDGQSGVVIGTGGVDSHLLGGVQSHLVPHRRTPRGTELVSLYRLTRLDRGVAGIDRITERNADDGIGVPKIIVDGDGECRRRRDENEDRRRDENHRTSHAVSS